MASPDPTSVEIGKQVESLACEHLQQQGLQLVDRNFRSRQGELDLVMQEGATLVFVEVRYRRNARFGSGADSVTRTKQDKLVKTALYYLQHHPRYAHWQTRFDVVSVSTSNQQPHFEWIKDAFQAEG